MITPGYADISILYVEPDESFRSSFCSRYLRSFKKVLLCGEAGEALKLLKSEKVELVISESTFDDMSGIDFLKHVRLFSKTLPFIFITKKSDQDFLIKAINYNISGFLDKSRSIDYSVVLHDLMLNNIMEYIRKDTLELEFIGLGSYEQYYSMRQDTAFFKELHLINDNMLMRTVESGDDLWLVDLFHKGLDVMSGDSYSLHRLDNGKLFCFLIDAMGSGLGAAVTSMQATTFLNYLVGKGYVNIKDIISEFLIYIRQSLLPDEILSGTLLEIDFENMLISYGSFGMPKGFIMGGGEVVLMKTNNMPITMYSAGFDVDIISFENYDKIFIFTDGFTEASNCGMPYSEYVEDDFRISDSIVSLANKFFGRGFSFHDDATAIFIKKQGGEVLFEQNYVINSSLKDISNLEREVERLLERGGISGSEKTMVLIAFSEAVMNAFEHGNLGLNMMQKHAAIEAGNYDDILDELQSKHFHKKIEVNIKYVKKNENKLIITVKDEGKDAWHIEPPASRDPYLLCGRGIEIIKQYMDGIYYMGNSNHVILTKTL